MVQVHVHRGYPENSKVGLVLAYLLARALIWFLYLLGFFCVFFCDDNHKSCFFSVVVVGCTCVLDRNINCVVVCWVGVGVV